MTTRNYSSRSQQTTLTSAVTAGASTIVVQSGAALMGGATIAGGTTFTLVIDPDTSIEEIVDATAVSTNTLTITRGIDGSSGQAHSAGAVVRHMAIGRDYREANAHIEASTGVHGISNSSSIVGTIDTQTLTNKTLTSPTITNPSISGAFGVDATIVFEGTTPDAFETTLTVVDPTQDNTLTLPNTTGAVVVDAATQTLTNKTLTSPTISGSPVITGLSSAGMSASSATPKDYVDSILGSATAASTSAASAATSAASAATSATSAATTYDNFDDRYLGNKSSAPTLDNDGNALIVGAMYWNDVSNLMFVWSGSAWVQITTTSSYSAPTLGSTTINSGATVTNVNGLTINSTTIPTSETLLTSGGALGTPTSGTLTNATGLPIAGLVASTSAALGVGSIELGHATDTTISRASAGVVNIEGVPIVTTTATQTLTNKTLTTPLIDGPILKSPEERYTVSATAATGTIAYDAQTQGVLYYTTNASGNWTLNIRGASGVSLNSILSVGDSMTVAFLVTNGATPYYQTAFQIDGDLVSVKWSGGTAPSAGNASSIDAYSFTIIKTAATPLYTVLGVGPVKYA